MCSYRAVEGIADGDVKATQDSVVFRWTVLFCSVLLEHRTRFYVREICRMSNRTEVQQGFEQLNFFLFENVL